MKKSEFIKNSQVAQRNVRRSLATGFAMAGVCCIIAAILQASPASTVIGAIGVAAFYLILVVSAIRNGVVGRCARCRKRLFGYSGQIAIATGHCGFCGESAFEQEAKSPA